MFSLLATSPAPSTIFNITYLRRGGDRVKGCGKGNNLRSTCRRRRRRGESVDCGMERVARGWYLTRLTHIRQTRAAATLRFLRSAPKSLNHVRETGCTRKTNIADVSASLHTVRNLLRKCFWIARTLLHCFVSPAPRNWASRVWKPLRKTSTVYSKFYTLEVVTLNMFSNTWTDVWL